MLKRQMVRGVLTAAMLMGVGGLAQAADIRIDEYDLFGQLLSTRTVAPGSAININLGSTPLEEHRTYLIYDTKTLEEISPGEFALPESTISTITVTGTATGPGWIRVAVVAGTTQFFAIDEANPLKQGVIFDPSTTTPLLTVTDSELRRRTALCAIIDGSLNAPVEVGQVVQIRARRYVPPGGGTSGGNIDADIVATQRDGFITDSIFTGHRAIGVIRAENRIAGNIIAQGRESDDTNTPLAVDYTRGSIGKVFLGPQLDAEGITGDIRAPLGRIGAIYSTGKIGTSATQRS